MSAKQFVNERVGGYPWEPGNGDSCEMEIKLQTFSVWVKAKVVYVQPIEKGRIYHVEYRLPGSSVKRTKAVILSSLRRDLE